MKSKIILLFICAALLLTGCTNSGKSVEKTVSLTDFYFDTVVSITIYDGNTDKSFNDIINSCFEKCADFEKIISKAISDSETSKINTSAGQTIEISDTEAELIAKSLYYSNLTDGAFDITIEPLSTLWNFGHDSAKVPSDNEIRHALSHVNYKNVQLAGNNITLKDTDASIDLGGIAKGFIADKLKDYLISEGITSALVNLGGNVVTIGCKPGGDDFKIGITKPFSDGEYSAIVIVNDKSVVTSGVYERSFYEDGKLYHHLLDPATGYPCNNGLYSVSIISDASVDGDALSTSCFILGLEKGMDLIHSLPDTEAIFIDDNNELHLSDGLSMNDDGNIITK